MPNAPDLDRLFVVRILEQDAIVLLASGFHGIEFVELVTGG
jgi:hypothetical protein